MPPKIKAKKVAFELADGERRSNSGKTGARPQEAFALESAKRNPEVRGEALRGNRFPVGTGCLGSRLGGSNPRQRSQRIGVAVCKKVPRNDRN
jgi:hypothetical protein